MRKNYILDTNVLLHDPSSLLSFQDNTVIVPIYVIEEVDHFKKEATELGRNARSVARILDGYRKEGKLAEGVTINGGGTLRVVFDDRLPLDRASASFAAVDNALLSFAVSLQDEAPDVPVILVTKDTNLRIKADARGIRAEDFETGRVDLNDLYRGAVDLVLPYEEVDRVRAGEEIEGPVEPCAPNEYAWLRSEGEAEISALARVTADRTRIKPLRVPDRPVWGLKPKNKEQYFALDALLDPEIKLVTLMGKAGTGKTILAIAAGLHLVEEMGNHGRLLVSRPIFPMGRDLGYLPGEIEEKLNPWMQPIYDNLEFLMDRQRSRKGLSITKMLANGTLGIEPITYIRGRSIPGQFLIVDEAQNLTPLEVKTIVTRVGEGTKIVLTGDPYQIDNPYVDASSNGFNYVAQRFRPEALAAHVELVKGERSELAEKASDLL